MKALVQRVSNAEIKIGETVSSGIEKGLVVFLGVEKGDSLKEAEFLANKIAGLRCFEDEKGKMDLSVKDINAEVLVVSEFTLCADLLHGRRPGFGKAAPAGEAEKLYQDFLTLLIAQGIRVAQGRFREHMVVNISNDGPVTFILNTRRELSRI
jgi:D-tyrosyl-tRNA(Tyr) deacylase